MKTKIKSKPDKHDGHEQSILNALDFKKDETSNFSLTKKFAMLLNLFWVTLKVRAPKFALMMTISKLFGLWLMNGACPIKHSLTILYICTQLGSWAAGQLINTQEVKELVHPGVFVQPLTS